MKYKQFVVFFIFVFNTLCLSAKNDESIPIPPPPPSNDECSGAIPLTVGTSCSFTQYTNASATASSGIPAPGCASYSGGDVWFSVVVPASGRLIIDTQTGSVTDGGMAIYSGTCGSLSLIECDDDDSNNGLMPFIDKSGLTVGATIYIRFWEYSNDNNGTFSICVYTTTSSGSSGATSCASADPFCTGTGLVFPASVNAGTGESGPDYGCLCTQPNPVWYYLRIANPGSLEINISSTCGDVDYAAWGPFPALTCSSSDLTSTVSSCGGNLSASAGNMVDCAYSTSATETLSIPSALTGQYYLVMITNYANCTGNINFNQTSGSGSTDCSIIAPPIVNNGPLCVGQTLNLTVSVPITGATYSWSGPDGFTSAAMNPSITNVTAANAGVYSLIISVGNVSSAPVTTTVVVNASPTASAGNNSPICAGTSLSLTASGGNSYSWSGPNSFTSTLQNPSISSTTVAETGTYTVTVTATGGCTATAQTTVTVNSTPIPTTGSNNPICAGNTLNLTASGGNSYSWSGPNSFASTLQNPSIANTTAAAAGTYTVTVTATGGCTATSQTIVTINPSPVPAAGNNSPICAGTALNLTASGGTGYSWSGPNSFTSMLQNPSITNTNTSIAGIYTVTVTATGGCTATTQTTVVVNGNISVVPTSNAPICQNQTLNLSVPISGATYLWSGPNSFNNTLQSPSITNASTAASGIYSVTVTNSNGCSGTATISVVVNPLPIITISGDSIICNGETTVLTASGGNSYVWSNALTFNAITVSPSAQTAYIVTATGIGGCTSTLTRTVFVNQNPQIDSVITTNENCSSGNGKATAFVSAGLSPYQYAWSNCIGNTPNDSLLTTGIYTVTTTDANGCSSTKSFTVQNTPGPILSITNVINDHCNQGLGEATVIVNNLPGNYTYSWLTSPPQQGITAIGLTAGTYYASVSDGICSDAIPVTINNINGPTANFEANPPTASASNALIHFIDQSNGAQSYLWNFGDGTSSFNESPIHSYLSSGSYSATFIVTDSYGCTDSISKTIVIYDDFNLFIPNAFTPNSDGLNEVFRPYGTGINLEKKYEMSIYDRWGKLVFITNRFEQGWDGKINNSKIKSNSSFAYQIKLYDQANQIHIFKGTVTVLGSKVDSDF